MNRENPWWGGIPLMLGLTSLPVYAQPGMDLSRAGRPFFQDYSRLHSRPNPFDETRPLELRVRSYLDANCSHCHRPGGVKNGEMDLRYATPLDRTALFAPSWRAGPDGRRLFHIQPGNVQGSEVYLRVASVGNDAMPPMGRTQVDEKALALIRDWINSFSPDSQPLALPSTERKFPYFLNTLQQELEIERAGLDSVKNLEIGIFNAAGEQMTGFSITANENSRQPGWILRLARHLPRGRYWMKLRSDAGKTSRNLLVL